ncbi:MAG TPA: hypothetical protein PL064_03625, partial [Thermogutta sp.]|nr:hypothetical protein [Thermogutta sp.]
GLSLGVKDFLHRVQTSESHLGDSVCGLVADLLQTELQVALLVDVALGDAAEWIVLRNSMPWLDQLRRGSAALNGRVCLLCLDQFRKKADGQSMPTDISSLGQEPGVLGLAEDFVQVEEEFLPVRHFLLGKTWFVESLDTALALASRYADLRFVTLAGELITSEGLIVAGQQSSGLGLVSRRSELRNLTRSIAQWDQQLQQYQEAIATSEHQLKTVEQRIANLEEQRRSLSQELKDCEQRQQELQRMLQEYLGRCGALEGEIAAAAEGVERIVQQQQQALLEKTQWEEKAAELSIAITQLGEEIAQLEANVQDRHGVLTALKIE